MNLRDKLVSIVLEWEREFGCFPGQAGVTAAVSEYDAAILLGCSEADYAGCLKKRTAVSKHYDFETADGRKVQVKANRPSGKPGSKVWNAGPKVDSSGWDLLVYILYDPNYNREEAWKFTGEEYERLFGNKKTLTLVDMRQGTSLTPDPLENIPSPSVGKEPVMIFTDGACRGNPGPGGWGAILRSANGKTLELSGRAEHTTNNQMELTAAIEALKRLTRKSKVVLTTDSEYLKNGITQWIHNWKKNGWRTADKKPVKNGELWVELDMLNEKHDVEWKWVKGHNGHPENERCDALANTAIDAPK